MVEAIEDLFVPVLIYNNQPQDKKLLAAFKEPAWNNPITRFLNSDGTDVIPRADRVWQIQSMATRMVAALTAARREVPEYVVGLAIDEKKHETATFAMGCFWHGEGKLGSIPGVSNTRSAWLDQHEVVEVTFDPEQVEYSKLVEVAQSFRCASKVFAHSESQLDAAKTVVGDQAVELPSSSRPAKLSDQKHLLRGTPLLRSLPLTTYQSTKINAALLNKTDVRSWLSPRQIERWEQMKSVTHAKTVFHDFVFSDDDSKLVAYDARLRKLLQKLSNNDQLEP